MDSTSEVHPSHSKDMLSSCRAEQDEKMTRNVKDQPLDDSITPPYRHHPNQHHHANYSDHHHMIYDRSASLITPIPEVYGGEEEEIKDPSSSQLTTITSPPLSPIPSSLDSSSHSTMSNDIDIHPKQVLNPHDHHVPSILENPILPHPDKPHYHPPPHPAQLHRLNSLKAEIAALLSHPPAHMDDITSPLAQASKSLSKSTIQPTLQETKRHSSTPSERMDRLQKALSIVFSKLNQFDLSMLAKDARKPVESSSINLTSSDSEIGQHVAPLDALEAALDTLFAGHSSARTSQLLRSLCEEEEEEKNGQWDCDPTKPTKTTNHVASIINVRHETNHLNYELPPAAHHSTLTNYHSEPKPLSLAESQSTLSKGEIKGKNGTSPALKSKEPIFAYYLGSGAVGDTEEVAPKAPPRPLATLKPYLPTLPYFKSTTPSTTSSIPLSLRQSGSTDDSPSLGGHATDLRQQGQRRNRAATASLHPPSGSAMTTLKLKRLSWVSSLAEFTGVSFGAGKRTSRRNSDASSTSSTSVPHHPVIHNYHHEMTDSTGEHTAIQWIPCSHQADSSPPVWKAFPLRVVNTMADDEGGDAHASIRFAAPVMESSPDPSTLQSHEDDPYASSASTAVLTRLADSGYFTSREGNKRDSQEDVSALSGGGGAKSCRGSFKLCKGLRRSVTCESTSVVVSSSEVIISRQPLMLCEELSDATRQNSDPLLVVSSFGDSWSRDGGGTVVPEAKGAVADVTLPWYDPCVMARIRFAHVYGV